MKRFTNDRHHPGWILAKLALFSVLLVLNPASITAQSLVNFAIGWGRNDHGQIDVPLSLSNAIAIRGGGAHAMGLLPDGNVVVWGDASKGQLDIPASVTQIIQIAAGHAHCLALRTDGRVVAWGDNLGGQSRVPDNLSNVVQIAAGAVHSIALLGDGTVRGWGSTSSLTTPFPLSNIKTVAAGSFHNLALSSNGNVVVWGYNINQQHQPPPGLGNVVAIAAGSSHNLALRSDGSVALWGDGVTTQLKLPGAESNIVAIAAGFNHSLLLRSDGRVLVYGGDSTQPQTSVPEGLKGITQIACGSYFNLALVNTGIVVLRQPTDRWLSDPEAGVFRTLASAASPISYQWLQDGQEIPGATNTSLTVPNAELLDSHLYRARISAGPDTTFTQPARILAAPTVLTPTRKLKLGFGTPLKLDAGVGGTTPLRYSWPQYQLSFPVGPTLIGTNRTLSYNYSARPYTNFSVIVENAYGSITSLVAEVSWFFEPTLTVDRYLRSPPVLEDTVTLSVTGGGFNPLVGYQWRWNGIDIPGATSSLLTNLGPADAGTYDCYQVMETGRVFSNRLKLDIPPSSPSCFVGRSLVIEIPDPLKHLSSVQWFHDGVELAGAVDPRLTLENLTLTNAGLYSARCRYQDGSEQTVSISQLVMFPSPPVGRPVIWGDVGSGIPAAMTNDSNWILIAASASGGIAVSADQHLTYWGLGANSTAASWPPSRLVSSIAIGSSLDIFLDPQGRFYPSSFFPSCRTCPDLTTNRFTSVADGGDYWVGLRSDGRVIAWGQKLLGRTDVPLDLTNATAIAAGRDFALALRRNGTIAMWGNTHSPPKDSVLVGIKAIACGLEHALALASNGTVIAWGRNTEKQTNIPSGLTPVKGIAAGAYQSAALREDGTVVVWGDNSSGQTNVPPGLSHVVAISSTGSTLSALVGSDSLPSIIEDLSDSAHEIGDSVTFAPKVFSSVPVLFQWQKDGVPLPTATNRVLQLMSLSLAEEGDYRLLATTEGGTTKTRSAHLFVNPPAHLKLPLTQGRLRVWGSSLTPLPESIEFGEVRHVETATPSTGFNVWRSDGTLMVWGTLTAPRPPRSDLVGWQARSFNRTFLGLKANGVLDRWTSESDDPKSAGLFRDVVQLAMTDSGTPYVLLGDGTLRSADGPLRLTPIAAPIQQIAPALTYLAVLLKNGDVIARGYPGIFLTAVPPADLHDVIQIASGAYHSLALKKNGTVVAWGSAGPESIVPPDLTDVIQIAASYGLSMALRSDGTVRIWGVGNNPRFSPPPDLTNIVAIAAGSVNCAAIQKGPAWFRALHDQYVRPGAEITLSVSAEGKQPIHYTWKHNGITLDGLDQPTLSFRGTLENVGTYSVVALNDDGEIRSEAQIGLALPPTLISEPQDYTAAIRQIPSFTVVAEGVEPLHYQWETGGSVTGPDQPTLTLDPATPSSNGAKFRVVVSNAFGSVTSSVATLKVVDYVFIKTHPQALTVVEGSPARFEVVPTGGEPESIQWRFNGIPLVGETQSTLSLPHVSMADAGHYDVYVSNRSGTNLSQSALLKVLDRAPHLTGDLLDQSVPFGSTLRCSVQLEGASPMSFRWTFDGSPIPEATSDTLVLSNADFRLQGQYQVIASNASGSVISRLASIRLAFGSNVVVWGSNTLATAVPRDLTNAVSVAASEHLLVLLDDGTVVGWGNNTAGQTTVPAGLSNVIAVAAGWAHSLALRSDGTVAAWGLNAWGQGSVPPQISNVVSIATGSNVNLAIRSDGTVAAWGDSRYGQTSVPPTLKDVIGIAANGTACFALKKDGTVAGWGTSANVPSGLGPLGWIGGKSRIIAGDTSNWIFSWGQAGDLFTEVFGSNLAGDSYHIPNPASPFEYFLWHGIGLLNSGAVYAFGYDSTGQFAPPAGITTAISVASGRNFNAVVLGGPTILLQPIDQTVLAGDTAEFSVDATDRLPLTYQWQHSGTNIPGAVDRVLRIQKVTPDAYGPYRVSVADRQARRASRSVTLRVITGPPYVTKQPNSDRVLRGYPGQLESAAEGAAPLTYQWYRSGVIIPGATQPTFRIESFRPEDEDLYSMRVSNGFGTAESRQVQLVLGAVDTVLPASDAQAVGTWQNGNVPPLFRKEVLYTAESTGTNRIVFESDLPRPGNYWVFTRMTPDLNLRGVTTNTTPLLHVIYHADGTTAILPSATPTFITPPDWQRLGRFSFDSHARVEVLDLYPARRNLGSVSGVEFVYSPTFLSLIPVTGPDDVTVLEGEPFELKFSASGDDPIRYLWRQNGNSLAGQTNSVLHIDHASLFDAGDYSAILWATYEQKATRAAHVEVRPAGLFLRGIPPNLEVFWNGTARLQTATNLTGPYETLLDATSPTPINPDEQRRYFRLQR